MNHDEFRLLAAPFDACEPTAMERMTPPTLDEWTVAIQTLKTRESGSDWFQRNGLAAADPYGNLLQQLGGGINQQSQATRSGRDAR